MRCEHPCTFAAFTLTDLRKGILSSLLHCSFYRVFGPHVHLDQRHIGNLLLDVPVPRPAQTVKVAIGKHLRRLCNVRHTSCTN